MKRAMLLAPIAALAALLACPAEGEARPRANVNVVAAGGSAAVSVQQRGGLFGLRRSNVNVAVGGVGGSAAVIQGRGNVTVAAGGGGVAFNQSFRRSNVNVAIGAGFNRVGFGLFNDPGYLRYHNRGIFFAGAYSPSATFALAPPVTYAYSFEPTAAAFEETTTTDACGRSFTIRRFVQYVP